MYMGSSAVDYPKLNLLIYILENFAYLHNASFYSTSPRYSSLLPPLTLLITSLQAYPFQNYLTFEKDKSIDFPHHISYLCFLVILKTLCRTDHPFSARCVLLVSWYCCSE